MKSDDKVEGILILRNLALALIYLEMRLLRLNFQSNLFYNPIVFPNLANSDENNTSPV